LFTVVPNAVAAAAGESAAERNGRVPLIAQLVSLVTAAAVLATGISAEFAALTEAVVMASVALVTVVYMAALRVTAPASDKASGKPWTFDPAALVALLMLLTAPALLAWPLSFAIRVRTLPNGMAWQLITGGAIWTADTGALILGSALGGPKMMPTVSPGKTVAGFVGSFVGAACVVYGFVWYDAGATLPLSDMTCVVLTVGLGGTAVIGDLLESSMKRAGHVKDSGGVLPGQGGLLDRMDSAVFAAPFIYFGVLHGLLK
jgi:phosphatidate cytidylyltransferase